MRRWRRSAFGALMLLALCGWLAIFVRWRPSLGVDDPSVLAHHRSGRHGDPKVPISYYESFYIASLTEDPTKIEGNYGQPVDLNSLDMDEQRRSYELHKFNEIASSRVALLRHLPEKRRKSCHHRLYSLDLPQASVVVIFRNEAWSTLLRTVHTVLSRSPPNLLKEVLLVDDHSNFSLFPHLGKPLHEHFAALPKVRIFRTSPRDAGLVAARLIGARAASGDVLVFLDSHCEAFNGWLEPLLQGIKDNPRIAITPIIDAIDRYTFQVDSHTLRTVNIGTFNWAMEFEWSTPHHHTSSSQLIRSPAMAGGLFAIGRVFFFEIGAYDEKMKDWGGENLEMSFRLWMCADGVYLDPCSVVGHVFRNSTPHRMDPHSVMSNKMRVVQVWLDGYKSLAYSHMGVLGHQRKAGNVKDRLQLRRRLGCKSFDWYLAKVASLSSITENIFLIRNTITGLCLERNNENQYRANLVLRPCSKKAPHQVFRVNQMGAIAQNRFCLELPDGQHGTVPILLPCIPPNKSQMWRIKERLIKNSQYGTCLRADPITRRSFSAVCSGDSWFQKWQLLQVRPPAP